MNRQNGQKIFVIGPIIPFTGGIAQSNTVLCTNLSKRNKVTAISYSMLYPSFFYPGKKQKDGSRIKTNFKQEFILNTLNPFSWIKIVQMMLKQKPDWVVFLWWHTYFFPSYFFISFFAKAFGIKVNVVCHNVLPHEEVLHKPLTRFFLQNATHIVTLSESEKSVAHSLLPHASVNFVTENSYSSLFPRPITQLAARRLLGIKTNKRVLLSFGAVRPYKGLGDLLEAMSIVLPRYPDCLLVVAGAFWEPLEKYSSLAKKLGISSSVLFIDKYIPDCEVHKYFCAANLLVLSHRTATQSAIPQLAYIYSLPIVATNVSGNKIFVDDGVNGFVVPSANPSRMAKAINDFFSDKIEDSFKRGSKVKAKQFEWTKLKEKAFFGCN
jgi:glycosyltransferase involved in cell wall biosynthesis